ncbi:MAG: HIT family protein [Paracoccaceae bacterium]|nr:HIT family protein [Paracoccaceae bacterium]
MKDCIFCEIAAGRAPAAMLFEGERLVAFGDTRPIRPGHVQIVPRAHVETFDDLPADLAAEIVVAGQGLARAMKRHYGVARVGFVFTGNEVAHVHAHLVPLHAATDITSRRYTDPGVPRVGPGAVAGEIAALRQSWEAVR